jgi:hypothetical protein
MSVSKYHPPKYNIDLKMCGQVLKTYLKPKDVASVIASKVLTLLNSSSTADEILNAINKGAEERVFNAKTAQKILDKKVELGGFKDLQQVAIVPGIGTKKFTQIVHALSE